MKLHIGARTRAEGWTTFDIVPGPEVDVIGDCRDLSQFASDSFDIVYASHVLEHVPYSDLLRTLSEWNRVLEPGGKLMVSVPDLNILSQIFVKPQLRGDEKVLIMQMMFGGQSDEYDLHRAGFDLEILGVHLYQVGFRDIARVPSFGLFEDTSELDFHGIKISLNVVAQKPVGAAT